MRVQSHIPLLLLLLLTLCLQHAHILVAQTPQIQPYISLTRQYDTDKWLLEANRSMDGDGIILQNRAYHPLGIAFLGIMRYEDFLATGDSTYYWQVVDQYKYFCDTSLVLVTDNGRGIELPYFQQFKDMPIPWISGMSQGAALSFLVRYHALTGDATALQKMEQVAYVLLKPVAQGGTIGKTAEGYPWIEEYPGSIMAPEVLNGFMAGLIGLHEYCVVFPQDTMGDRLQRECYRALWNTISAYDTPEWTDYKRMKNSVLKLSYMRYQLAELEHLYEIYHDGFLERQAMIWGMMTYDQVDSSQKCYRMPDYQFAKAISSGLEGKPLADAPMFAANMRSLGSDQKVGGLRLEQPAGQATALYKGLTLPFSLPPETFCVRAVFGTSLKPNALNWVAEDLAHQPVPLAQTWDGNALWLTSQQPIAYLKLIVAGPCGHHARLEQMQVLDHERQGLPKFGFYKIEEKPMLQEGQTYNIMLEMEHIVGGILFYRTGATERRFQLAVWNKDASIDLPADTFKAPSTGLYEFFIAFPLRLPSPRIGKFALVP
jgi:hypothetical protein